MTFLVAEVYLSAVGGGAFGNRTLWIVEAIERALRSWMAPISGFFVGFWFRNVETMRFLHCKSTIRLSCT